MIFDRCSIFKCAPLSLRAQFLALLLRIEKQNAIKVFRVTSKGFRLKLQCMRSSIFTVSIQWRCRSFFMLPRTIACEIPHSFRTRRPNEMSWFILGARDHFVRGVQSGTVHTLASILCCRIFYLLCPNECRLLTVSRRLRTWNMVEHGPEHTNPCVCLSCCLLYIFIACLCTPRVFLCYSLLGSDHSFTVSISNNCHFFEHPEAKRSNVRSVGKAVVQLLTEYVMLLCGAAFRGYIEFRQTEENTKIFFLFTTDYNLSDDLCENKDLQSAQITSRSKTFRIS